MIIKSITKLLNCILVIRAHSIGKFRFTKNVGKSNKQQKNNIQITFYY